jgi:hypothetical protein
MFCDTFLSLFVETVCKMSVTLCDTFEKKRLKIACDTFVTVFEGHF